jgi:glycopeptide antibiotics resistance protein
VFTPAVRYILLGLWLLAVVVAVVPARHLQDHPHWSRVQWVPYGGPLRFDDIVRNVVLYAPFGFLLAGDRRAGRFWTVAGCALAISLTTEVTQLFSHSRVPSASDLVSNTTGALLGFGLGQARRMRRGGDDEPSMPDDARPVRQAQVGADGEAAPSPSSSRAPSTPAS